MSDLNIAAASFDFSSLNFDLNNVSDMPADLQKKFEKKVVSSGPSEDQALVAALLNSVPGKRALTSVKMSVLVRRFRNIPAETVLEETTVRGWLNRAVDHGLIAKAKGKLGFCALDSEDRASEEELAGRRALIQKARDAKAAQDKAKVVEEIKAEEAAPSTAGADLLSGLGL